MISTHKGSKVSDYLLNSHACKEGENTQDEAGSLQIPHHQGNLKVSWALFRSQIRWARAPLYPTKVHSPSKPSANLQGHLFWKAPLPPSSGSSETISVPQHVHMVPCSSFNKLPLTQNISVFKFTKMWGLGGWVTLPIMPQRV